MTSSTTVRGWFEEAVKRLKGIVSVEQVRQRLHTVEVRIAVDGAAGLYIAREENPLILLSFDTAEEMQTSAMHELAHWIAHEFFGTMEHDATWCQILIALGYEEDAERHLGLPRFPGAIPLGKGTR